MRLVLTAKPRDLDLAIPPLEEGRSGLTLAQIAQGYSIYVTPDWQYAANVEYRSGENGPSVSLLAQGGRIWTRGDPRWPCFHVLGDVAKIGSCPGDDVLKSCRFAFSAGPMLVRSGKLCNVAEEIRLGEYSGLREGQPVQRGAVGIRSDGTVVYVADTAATLDEMASVMRARGCIDAMSLDGGDSLGVVDPGGRVIIGHSARQVCSALIFRRAQVAPPFFLEAAAAGGVGGSGAGTVAAKVICLDPGHGGRDRSNIGRTGYVEADGALDIALDAAFVLASHGFKVVMTRATDTDLAGRRYTQSGDLGGRVYKANKSKADVFVSIHTNAGGGNGTETWCYEGSRDGWRLAQSIHRALVSCLRRPSRGVKEGDFYILRKTAMPACLTEVVFHDNPEEERLLKEPLFRARAGFAVALGVMRYFGATIDDLLSEGAALGA